MKRAQKNPYIIYNELVESGLTQKKIASKMGIAPRTLRSYYASMKADRGTKWSTPIPEKRLKALKSIAKSKKIRVTKDIETDPLKTLLLYISCDYLATLSDGVIEARNATLTTTEAVFYQQTDKDQFLIDKILNQYETAGSVTPEIEIINYSTKNENELTNILKTT